MGSGLEIDCVHYARARFRQHKDAPLCLVLRLIPGVSSSMQRLICIVPWELQE